jgi:hypothetical protein
VGIAWIALSHVLVGKAQGKVPMSRYLKYNGDLHNKPMATFMNIFGINVNGFGEAMFPGVLPGIAV